MSLFVYGKVERVMPWICPDTEKGILKKLNPKELEYLRGQKIFSESDIICELLERAKNKKVRRK